MADKKISALTAATTPLAGTEVLPIVQSGATVKVAVSDLTAGRAISATSVTASTGNFVVGTSGQGVDFSATPGTGTSELLADYEEGTWTPVIADAGSGGNTGTCTIINATYTKIGRQVTVQALIVALNTTGMTAGNLICVRGLPFTASDYAQGSFYTYRVARAALTVSSSAGLAASTAVFFRLYTVSSVTTDTYILVSDIVSGTSEIGFTVTYTV
jgi:hypothetical protein